MQEAGELISGDYGPDPTGRSSIARCRAAFEVGLIPALSLWSLRGWAKFFRRVDSGPPLAAGVFPLDVENPNPGGSPGTDVPGFTKPAAPGP